MTGAKRHPLLHDMATLMLPRLTLEELQYLHHLVQLEQRSRLRAAPILPTRDPHTRKDTRRPCQHPEPSQTS